MPELHSGPTYTAEELAQAVNRRLGTELRARTVYFYRTKGVLSPLVMSGSQPKFTERHRLELLAALTLQSSADRPSLDEVAARLRGLDDGQLALLAAAGPPSSERLLSRVSLSAPLRGMALGTFGPEPETVKASRTYWREIRIEPDIILRLGRRVGEELAGELERRIRNHLREQAKEEQS